MDGFNKNQEDTEEVSAFLDEKFKTLFKALGKDGGIGNYIGPDDFERVADILKLASRTVASPSSVSIGALELIKKMKKVPADDAESMANTTLDEEGFKSPTCDPGLMKFVQNWAKSRV
jgi:hypothetical protein